MGETKEFLCTLNIKIAFESSKDVLATFVVDGRPSFSRLHLHRQANILHGHVPAMERDVVGLFFCIHPILRPANDVAMRDGELACFLFIKKLKISTTLSRVSSSFKDGDARCHDERVGYMRMNSGSMRRSHHYLHRNEGWYGNWLPITYQALLWGR